MIRHPGIELLARRISTRTGVLRILEELLVIVAADQRDPLAVGDLLCSRSQCLLERFQRIRALAAMQRVTPGNGGPVLVKMLVDDPGYDDGALRIDD